jgi:phosphoglycerate kinase
VGAAGDRGAEHLPLLEDLGDLSGKRVLVRLDLNVPLAESPGGGWHVADDFRIVSSLPTLRYLVEGGARVTVITHLGRPDGSVVERYAIEPVRARLAELGMGAAAGVEVWENLRFSPGEKANSPEFVASLVDGHDAYVDDAFGVMHRAHASVVGPPAVLPSAAGRLVEREVTALLPLISSPPRPFVMVVGGAKVSDKLGLLRALLERADRVLVGGGMAFSFLAALGHSVGGSLVDPSQFDACRELVSGSGGSRIVLPCDLVAAAPGVDLAPSEATGADAVNNVVSDSGDVRVFGLDVPDGWRGFDIGPETSVLFAGEIAQGGAVMWNGPMGVFEDPRFAAGTYEVARAMAGARGQTIVGGGDSAAALARFDAGLADAIDHISTGGGASLELLEFGDLPGLAALRAAWRRTTGAPGATP